MSAEKLPARRLFGAFYTPDVLADVLARWCTESGPVRLLDPSAGPGSLLAAGVRALAQRSAPGPLLWGADIDAEAAIACATLIEANGGTAEQVVHSDFLALRPHHFPEGGFGGVLANPPYVRHHWLTPANKAHAAQAMKELGVELPARASSWAHFLIHAVRFVALGGRMAFVLPGAVLHADYADAALEYVATNFGGLRMLRISEQVFPDVQEETVLLLASDRGRRTVVPAPQQVSRLAGLAAALSEPTQPIPSHDWKLELLPVHTRDLWLSIAATAVPLAKLASVSIGVVTGANSFFVRAPDDPMLTISGVRSDPVVSRGAWLQAATWSAGDHAALAAGTPTRLAFISPLARRSPRMRALLTEAEAAKLDQRHHCSKRKPWYQLDDARAPDAFLHYMRSDAPRLVRNDAGATCTNAIHRVSWLGSDRALAGTWTSFFALSAELLGRHYGGGVLKLEIGDAKALPLLPHAEDCDAVEAIDRAARSDGAAGARTLADRLVLSDTLGLTALEVRALSDGHQGLRSRRLRDRVQR